MHKNILFTLWIFVLFNYLYCDVVGLMDSNLLKQFFNGKVDDFEITQNFLLASSVLMEIPMIMILVSKFVSYKYNRVLNIISSTIMSLVQTSTLLLGTPTKYYVFFSLIEISTTVFILIFSVKYFREDR